MKHKNKKRLQVINYIVHSLKPTDGLSKESVCKLVYMANKLFLLKYGCTITGDRLIAMVRGTTCSETLAIMDKENKYVKDRDAINSFNRQYECTVRKKSGKVHSIFPKNEVEDNFDALSDKEMEIINIVITRFGSMRDDEISTYTHNFLEWQKFKDANVKSLDIDMNEVFADETFWEDVILSRYLSKEHRQIPHMIFNGDLD